MSQQPQSREESLVESLKKQFADAVKETKIPRPRRVEVTFDKDRLLDIARYMHDELGFDHLKGIAGVDQPTHKRIEVLYFLGSFTKPETEDLLVMLKADLTRDNPTIASATAVWQSAHFHEREVFEMFGVKFEGHSDLRKLLTLDNWDGPPPMLKDIRFPEMGQR